VIVPAKPLIAASASLPEPRSLESTSRFGERGAAEPELDLADLQSDSVRRSLLLALEHDTPAGAREQGASHGRLGVEKRRTIGAAAAADQDHQAYSWSTSGKVVATTLQYARKTTFCCTRPRE
jgi:hypothetical protein